MKFNTLWEYVRWAEDPSRLGEVSGRDADGDSLRVVDRCGGFFVQVHVDGLWSDNWGPCLPIEAIDPDADARDAALAELRKAEEKYLEAMGWTCQERTVNGATVWSHPGHAGVFGQALALAYARGRVTK